MITEHYPWPWWRCQVWQYLSCSYRSLALAGLGRGGQHHTLVIILESRPSSCGARDGNDVSCNNNVTRWLLVTSSHMLTREQWEEYELWTRTLRH